MENFKGTLKRYTMWLEQLLNNSDLLIVLDYNKSFSKYLHLGDRFWLTSSL